MLPHVQKICQNEGRNAKIRKALIIFCFNCYYQRWYSLQIEHICIIKQKEFTFKIHKCMIILHCRGKKMSERDWKWQLRLQGMMFNLYTELSLTPTQCSYPFRRWKSSVSFSVEKQFSLEDFLPNRLPLWLVNAEGQWS